MLNMIIWRCLLSTGILVLLMPLVGYGNEPQIELEQDIVPNPRVQLQIGRTVDAFGAWKMRHTGADHAFRELSNLKMEVGKDDVKLVPQLIYYEAKAIDAEKAILTSLIFQYGDISSVEIAAALAPYVWAQDSDVRRKIHHTLASVENRKVHRPPDFTHYKTVLRDQREQPPLALILYMYHFAPGEALLTSMHVFSKDAQQRKTILWSEHVISDVLWKKRYGFKERNEVAPEAATELDKLSLHHAWWVRLYVAEIMRQHRGFRRPEIIERLTKDDHPLVREAMRFADENAKK